MKLQKKEQKISKKRTRGLSANGFKRKISITASEFEIVKVGGQKKSVWQLTSGFESKRSCALFSLTVTKNFTVSKNQVSSSVYNGYGIQEILYEISVTAYQGTRHQLSAKQEVKEF